jgi:molecular chaperone DnaK (HSP70)
MLIGIDLGTSNCAMAFAAANGRITDFSITQIQSPAQIAALPLLPSCIYLPGEHELPSEVIALPWDPQPVDIIGEFARWQGARVPGRLVVSAKSWLSHSGVDRTASILPWGAPPDVPKMSPVEASARLLRHMLESWNLQHPEAPLAEQEVVITVPASFDEVARALTVTAARQGGIEKFTLLEEPQAAFYDFTRRHGETGNARLVLVVDVGGGTSDFTLVEVHPELRRIAVGNHLMLGGDNMDAAIGRQAEQRLTSSGRKLSPAQWTQLLQLSRLAKEMLLGPNPPDTYHMSLAGEGSRLIGSALSTELSRVEIEQIILEGFFPLCTTHDLPQRTTRTALQEFGLPFAQDPAITRQLAGFLRAHAHAGFPDAILLNGGVFNSAKIAARLVEVVSNWRAEAGPMQVLAHESLELAVARGAAYYGLVRHGMGRRIGGGTAHAFFIGLDRKRDEPPAALCVIPRGHEEGQTVELSGRSFSLTLGRPVQFPLFTSTSEINVKSGEVVQVTEDLDVLPPIHTVLQSAEEKTGSVPVHLRAALTEIGTLELWCVSGARPEQWRLEFELRGAAASTTETVIEPMPPRFREASRAIEQVFGGRAASGPEAPTVRQLWRNLEQILGSREQWRVPVLRELWKVLFAGAGRRRRSADHERVFFQLLGYSLRPGFGYPLDEWRAEQSAQLFAPGVHFHKEKPPWIEFWVMWRRIAGGLTEQRHLEIWNYLKPHLERRLTLRSQKNVPKPKGIQPEGLDEMVRLAASLEHLPNEQKIALGDWIAQKVLAPGPWAWALGRLGSRVPLYGSVHRTIDAEKASDWLKLLLDNAGAVEGALFAIVQIARLTGDRSRDLDDDLRARAMHVLQSAGVPDSWQRPLAQVIAVETADKARAFGDTLPAGLAM